MKEASFFTQGLFKRTGKQGGIDELNERVDELTDHVDDEVERLDGRVDTKQDTLVSGSNIKTINKNSVLGSGDLEIAAYLGFPTGWPTNTTFDAFLAAIDADETAIAGKAYIGELSCSSGLPKDINNAEAVVEITTSRVNDSKCIHVTLTSGNLPPYRWEYTYWDGGTGVSGWVSFQPELVAGDKVAIAKQQDSNKFVISATYTAFTGTDGTAAGVAGLVPAPAIADAGKFLGASGTWETPVQPPQVTWYVGDGTAVIDATADVSKNLSAYGCVKVYRNGMLVQEGVTADYTLSGKTIVFNYVINSSDKVALEVI